ncbi:uncharacterized protein LOC116304992 [Actinia tenebrosa]|uniref:Uncharacterized protein LOC116304992 n=1 Tax=Actinia tenebrosa TaxID=6105 RepID=A0A6P8IUR0_ACTTE|nr:uncharacterized protein LOC116304992 [Actinia tenebrosa]
MQFLSLLMVTMLLLQELPFTVSQVEKDQSNDCQKRKVKSDASVQDTKNKGRNNIATSDYNNIVPWRPLSDEEAKIMVTKKGVLKNPAIRLVTVSGDLLKALKAKETVSFSLPEQRKKIPNHLDLCQEEEVNNYTRLTPHGSLAYQIKGARCSKGKGGKKLQQCGIGSFPFGKCVEKKSVVVISVFNAKGGSFQKTIEFISSCKCQKYRNI